MELTDTKKSIAKNFSKYALSYDQYAEAQKIGAMHLINHIRERCETLPGGPILEIGCGTGFVSSALVALFPERDILVTDISRGMLDICQKKIKEKGLDTSKVSWKILDGETIQPQEYAMIVSGFTFQWFENLNRSMINFREALAPGGWICCSFLGEGSFKEWKAICEKMAIPYTGNPLARKADIEAALAHDSVQLETFQEDITLTYKSPLDFFYALKKIGAGTRTRGKVLSPGQMKKLIKAWQETAGDGINITYQINYALVNKNDESL